MDNETFVFVILFDSGTELIEVRITLNFMFAQLNIDSCLLGVLRI